MFNTRCLKSLVRMTKEKNFLLLQNIKCRPTLLQLHSVNYINFRLQLH